MDFLEVPEHSWGCALPPLGRPYPKTVRQSCRSARRRARASAFGTQVSPPRAYRETQTIGRQETRSALTTSRLSSSCPSVTRPRIAASDAARRLLGEVVLFGQFETTDWRDEPTEGG